MKIFIAALIFLLSSIPAQADINTQMQSMFGSMTNATNPQAFHGQMSSGASGGSVFVRNKIMNTNFIGFVPPRISAGCGGIDMFGGSFSFINAAQFTQFLKSVASNAQGYFFQLALQSICGDCLELMSALQKTVQDLNSMMSNSCQVAKGLVDGALDMGGLKKSEKKAGGIRDTLTKDFMATSAAFTDIFSADHSGDGQNKEEKTAAANPTKTKSYMGNIAWVILNGGNVKTAFAGGGDKAFKEALMSFTGTSITQMPNGATSLNLTTVPATIGYKELLFGSEKSGGKVEILQCQDSQFGVNPITEECLSVVPTKIIGFKGFSQMVREILIGTSTSSYGGLVDKLRVGIGTGGLTANEKALIENIPEGFASMLRSLAINGDGTSARVLAINYAPVIAAELVTQFIDETTNAIKLSMVGLPNEQSAAAASFADTMAVRRKALFNERVAIKTQRGGFSQMYNSYQAIRSRATPLKKFIMITTRPLKQGS